MSRYGNVSGLDAVTEEMTLTKDHLDVNETAQQLATASTLARELCEQVVPEINS